MTTEFIKQPGFLGAAFRLRRVPPGQDRSSGARVLWRRPAPATWTAWPMAFFEPTGTTCVSLGSLRCRARFVTPSASRLVVIVRTAQGRPESAGERLRRLHEDIDGGLDAGLDAAGYLGQGDRGRPDRVDQPSAAVDGRPHGAAGRPARGGGAGSTRGIRRSRPMTTRRRRRLRLTDAPRNTRTWTAAARGSRDRPDAVPRDRSPIWPSERSAASDIELDVRSVELGRGCGMNHSVWEGAVWQYVQ